MQSKRLKFYTNIKNVSKTFYLIFITPNYFQNNTLILGGNKTVSRMFLANNIKRYDVEDSAFRVFYTS